MTPRHRPCDRVRLACLLLTALLAGPGAGADARFDYLLYCGGCHLENGAGSPPEVPDLRRDLDRIVLLPGGRAYLAQVPGASQAPLSDARLAAVLNWIIRTYYPGVADFLPYSAAEIADTRGTTLLDPMRRRDELMAGTETPSHRNFGDDVAPR